MAQRFILIAMGVTQIVPLTVSGYLVAAGFSDGPFPVRRLAAGVCFLGVAGANFTALFRDLRQGERFNRTRAFAASVVLALAGVILLIP